MSTTATALGRVTKDMGATIKPGPMVVVAPEQMKTDADFMHVAADSGLNGPLLADLVVSMAVHENMAVNMYRALQTVTTNPMLRSVFADFEQDSVKAVAVHAELMQTLEIPMYYVSPAGRMTEGLDAKMIESFLTAGSADPVTIDLKAVEAVLLGSTMCVANTGLLRAICDEAEGATRTALQTAIDALHGPQTDHLEWATQTQRSMVLTMVKHPTAHKLAQFAETVVAKIKGVTQ